MNIIRSQEFETLTDDANVFKLVGPVLLKQDKDEAVAAVDGRLEFIGGEMYVLYFSLFLFFSSKLPVCVFSLSLLSYTVWVLARRACISLLQRTFLLSVKEMQ